MPKLRPRKLTDTDLVAVVEAMSDTEVRAFAVEMIRKAKRLETVAVAASEVIEKRTGGRIRREDVLTPEFDF